jgi:glycosyltransferase involved in cell wall biosynthesis
MIGFFGRFVEQKGFVVLLDALKLLAQRGHVDRLRLVATLDRVAHGHWHPRWVENDEILSRMVRFIEPVTEIAPVLSQMDALVMPSLWEACPLLPMEAMVLGVPVVGSDAIGLREALVV